MSLRYAWCVEGETQQDGVWYPISIHLSMRVAKTQADRLNSSMPANFAHRIVRYVPEDEVA